MVSSGDANTCFLRGGTVVTIRSGLDPFGGGSYIDTLCEETVYNINYQQAHQALWETKSDLKRHQPATGNRRILEVAFSEDDPTNYTYLVTLGDASWRRCDLYFNDSDAAGCDTCFVRKTAHLPYDASIPNQATYDPNPVTGIAVDPLNGDRVWVTFSGYSTALKVWYSEDAGDTWASYDDSTGSLAGLNLPINGIVYQRNTNDRLYIATDAGIYVREGTGKWLRYGDDFPNVRVTELKINYCVGKLRAATFGRGLWEADVLPAEQGTAFRSYRSVDADETWTLDKHLSRDIRVKAGAILHLQHMTLNMPKDGLIVVEPGGRLLVDSSTITNLCGQGWQGIEVWGNTSLEQHPSTNQGELIVIGSMIEHAKEAVSPWQVGNFPKPDGTGGTGGIVRAINSTFRNNKRSASFMQYQSPSSTYGEASKFVNCTFTVDSNNRHGFLGHVSAWDVGRLSVTGCTFNDQRANKTGDGYGLLTLSASVQVTAQPNGGNFQRNTVAGLSRGIVLGSSPTRFSNVVDQTDFVDNHRGVIVRASGGLKVLRNTFEVGADDTDNAATAYGLSVLRQGDFIAEENDFVQAAGTPNLRVSLGFWVDDLGSGFNRIRRNTFTNLSIANLAHGNSGADASNPFGGLRYHCNGQTGNAFDLTVMQAYQAPIGAAIGTDQGSNGQPAYNSFSYPLDGSFGIDWHFSNDASMLNKFNYWLPPNPTQAQEPTDTINIRNLKSITVGASDFCDPTYINLGFFRPMEGGVVTGLSTLKTSYYQYWNDYQQLSQAYQNDPTSTTLPSELGTKGQQVTSKVNEVLFYYRNDTTGTNWDSIAVWIQHKIGLSADYELVEHYWSGGRYADGLQHLSAIANTYDLVDVVLDNHQDYSTLLNLLHTAYEDNRTEATLTKDEVIALNELVDRNYGFAAIKAANIVDFFYSDTYRYHPTLPEEGQEKRAQPPVTKVAKGNLNIYPNPTTDWADISYKLPEDATKGRLVVTSIAGQQVITLNLSENQGLLTLNTGEWLAGTYFVVLYTEDKAVEQTQLLIRK